MLTTLIVVLIALVLFFGVRTMSAITAQTAAIVQNTAAIRAIQIQPPASPAEIQALVDAVADQQAAITDLAARANPTA